MSSWKFTPIGALRLPGNAPSPRLHERRPRLPENAPFSPEQRAWGEIHLAGLFAQTQGPAAAATPRTPSATALHPARLDRLGSQTPPQDWPVASPPKPPRGFQANGQRIERRRPVRPAEGHPCIPSPAPGDGDPPDNAADFWNRIRQDAAPKLEGVSYAVLSDWATATTRNSAGPQKLDERLSQRGAVRLGIRGNAILITRPRRPKWIDSLWEHLAPSEHATPHPATPAPRQPRAAYPAGDDDLRPDILAHPFPARLKVNRPLNGAGSEKDTRHFGDFSGGFRTHLRSR